MKPKEFRKRYIKSFPKNSSSKTKKFVVFIDSTIGSFSLDSDDHAILIDVGLPESAAPFLSFYAYDKDKVEDISHLVLENNDYFIIGRNGSGDAIAIELNNGHIVYFNHDMNFEKVINNSCVVALAERLCLYSENINTTNPYDLRAKLIYADPIIEDIKGFWISEIEMLHDEIS